MGKIDCDPATTAFAQRTIRANAWFDKRRDGLKHSWGGNVWLNPPYGRSLIEAFVAKGDCGGVSVGTLRAACGRECCDAVRE